MYYSESNDGGKLYSADLKNNNFKKICDDVAFSINVVGEYIYYSNASDNHKIYKIKVDGTGRTKLTDMEFINVIVEDSYIYATDVYSSNIYKISVDGKIIKKLGNDSAVDLNITQDYLYYSNANDNFKIYRITKNGSGRIKVSNESAGDINVVEDFIFYINLNDNSKVYKIKTDGTNKTKISDLSAMFLNVANNGRIYLVDSSTVALEIIENYGMGDSGSLMNIGYYPNVIDEYVYYINSNDNWAYRTKNRDPQNDQFGVYIKSAENVSTTAVQGVQYTLPQRVKITTIANRQTTASVIWNVKEIDTSQVGQYTFEGTLL